MASRQQMAQRHAHHGGYAPNHAAVAIAAPPPGTFAPGTKIQVGSHRVVIQKYLSEGGFAHVYLVRLPKPIDGTDLAVLKRVAVPDKEALRSMRTEVETMKRLKGHRPIVTYYDSHASELHGGGYEVFLLMEYCDGGGLIDFMNTRLQHRLTEPEIINIFADIAEGVACMHYLKPPLLHRDLKVENVLITSRGSHKRFKLCDFGSAAPPRPAPTTVVECRLADEDVQRHTTLQYRSPEMIDVYRKQPLNEKSDIWALGVLLYKLCYYTTPFEDQGQLAILNASYRCPNFPVFSDRLKKLIASMLRESMDARPTIYQVLKEACSMQNRDVPIHDIYTGKAAAPQKNREGSSAKPHAVGAVFTEPEHEKRQQVPDVVPMRRGRPTASEPTKAAPKPSTTNGDPFAALDSKGAQVFETDDLSARFPTVDQFSLLLDQGAKFDFDSGIASPSPQPPAPSANLSQRLTERLADAAFVSPQASAAKASTPVLRPDSAAPKASDRAVTSPPLARPASAAPPTRPTAELSRAQSIISNNPDLRAISSQATSRYVSKGTMTSDISPERSAHQSQQDSERKRHPNKRLSSHQILPSHSRQQSLSSRPSLEDNRGRGALQDSAASSGSPTLRPRPASTTFESSTLEFLREREASKAQSRPRPTSRVSKHRSSSSLNATAFSPDSQSRTPSANELLIDVNESDSDIADALGELGRPKRSKSSRALGSRNKLAGKFGHALKRFESADAQITSGSRDSSPVKSIDRRDLTPIAGSVATDGRSEDGLIDLDEQDATPEMRRELERRKLEEEERRVAAAQAEYRQRVTAGGGNSKPVPGPKKVGGAALAASIQSRVQSLLEEEQRPPQVTRTAKGYGKYSDAATAASKTDKPLPAIPKKPKSEAVAKSAGSAAAYGEHAPTSKSLAGASAYKASSMSSSSNPKPTAPRKPVHLNSFPPGVRPPSPAKREQPGPQREVLMAEEMSGQPVLEMTAQERDEYVENFAKRFPSLGAMELQALQRRGD
ncbi:hypothetical protein CDD81_574 [Ophiocordyceps australis]|uniref:non-specific serine/threonine protein kinase n=1 Tax=Ophiocordyceps australis TaxID=1399860 RepID=A0A2C5XBF3_9HYPO|nr:hypothetical protein CDD81_574 [Ophiocordyceps australis]